MKTEEDFLHAMVCDPFFVHYHNEEQIHLYRSYCHNVSHPKIVIDATGSAISSFKKLGEDKTKYFFFKH